MLINRNNKKVDVKDEINKKIEIDKQDFWLLVKSAYKAILPFVFIIILVYFLFTLFLTKVILK